MSFWKSNLIKNLEGGELPTIKTEVTIERSSLIQLGIVLVSVATAIILVSAAVKAMKS